MVSGIVGWGVYLPFWRLERASIGAAFGTARGRGSRSVASFDEDTTTLGVEAGRRCLELAGTVRPSEIVFATPDPAYLDKTNATTVHAALGLDPEASAYDACGSVRSAWGALRSAARTGVDQPALAVLSDLRTGLAGGSEESQGGDGACAFLFAPDGGAAELLGRGSATDEVTERWRVPGEIASRQWEDRFGEVSLVPLAKAAFERALADCGLSVDEVDHLVVAGLHTRAVGSVRASLGVDGGRLAPDHSQSIGNLGAAQAGVALADVLERAEPAQIIAVLVVGDGADCVIMRTTENLVGIRQRQHRSGLATVAEQVESGQAGLPYAVFLSWRGLLRREPPRRPDPERPDAPAVRRNELWKFGFSASRCRRCAFVHLPPTRVCLSCRAVDQMEPLRLSGVYGTVATFTVDHLAFSPSPPLIGAVVDFDGGGRYRGEMTDVDPDQLAIGTRVEMTFRRFYTAQGVHNYFWKARPVSKGRRGAGPGEGARSADTSGISGTGTVAVSANVDGADGELAAPGSLRGKEMD